MKHSNCKIQPYLDNFQGKINESTATVEANLNSIHEIVSHSKKLSPELDFSIDKV